MHIRVAVVFAFFYIELSIVSAFTSKELRVTLTNGSKLVGKHLRSLSGRPIKAFTNIPYAKPPIGPLRFKAPQPLERWDGEYKAINDGSKCTQRDPFIRSYVDEGSEDCLHLNVYVPHSYHEEKVNLPVMAYFHGGGFVCGSGIRPMYDPAYFLDHDVIFVTSNYRLGPLGFLSTEDSNCPGNFGLKDQVMVLRWINENIRRFGGDPDNVTIYGASAGGSSVTYLMSSPLAEGLFSKAIAVSATHLAPWAMPAHKGVAKKRTTQLARKFDCFIPDDWSQSIDCLRNVSATNITAAFYDFFDFDMDPMVAFTPVVESDTSGAFITKNPLEGVSESSLKIPLLTGITHDEGLMKSTPIFRIPGLFNDFATNLSHALPIAFYYDHLEPSVQQSITNQINDFYFNSELSRDKLSNVTNLFSDAWFVASIDSYLQQRLAHEDASPTFVYMLTHRGSASFTELFANDPETFYGVSHADEKFYFFPVKELFPNALPTKEDEQMRASLIQMWVNFARNGSPTPESSTLPKWEEARDFPLKYYRLGNLHLEHKPMFETENDGLFEERCQFWRKISANLSKTNIKPNEEL